MTFVVKNVINVFYMFLIIQTAALHEKSKIPFTVFLKLIKLNIEAFFLPDFGRIQKFKRLFKKKIYI